MAEMNVMQIVDKLNAEFQGDTRKLVFWYDDKAEFAEEIHTMELVGAHVYFLEPDNQFYTKFFLERLYPNRNFLVYAPFPRPAVIDHHLEDMLLYSKQFYADRASLLLSDLGIDEQYKPIIQRYAKFFGAKDRMQKFYDLTIEHYHKDSIEIGLMCVLSKTSRVSFEEVVRIAMTESDQEHNVILAEFGKYDLLQSFWRICTEQLGYQDEHPSINKLMMTMFVTYTDSYLQGQLPSAWKRFVSDKSGNIIAFMDDLMHSRLHQDIYDQWSEQIASTLQVSTFCRGYSPDILLECDTFRWMDQFLIEWLLQRLLDEDTGAKLQGMDISAISQYRKKKHFGEVFQREYDILQYAYALIRKATYSSPVEIDAIIHQYSQEDYQLDTYYREFYYAYDRLSDDLMFEQLRDRVEAIYSNKYLSVLLPKWNEAFQSEKTMNTIPLQRNFFDQIVRPVKDKLVVIISDALRYETGRALYQKFLDDPKSTVKIESMLGVLPSMTKLGMACLLPHRNIEMTSEYKVLVDGMPCEDIKQREAILQRYVKNSRCVQFEDMKMMKQAQLREIFTGMEVVYVYHNQIDARGDKLNTENEVFNACAEAIEEIYDLVKRLSGTANTHHFMVTADHGFLYTRDKLEESDKIDRVTVKGAYVNRRFIMDDTPVQEDGVAYTSLGWILGNQDDKVVSYPVSSNVFKVPGGGQNYVHGGSSPQELMIPLLDIKMEKGMMETRPAQIKLISTVHKITNLIVFLDFIQSEAISDIVKQTTYRVCLIDGNEEKISNESVYIADKKDADAQNRMFRLKFNLKNKRYDRAMKYYLVAMDEHMNMEVMRHDVFVDIAFANDFGFNV